ncbi:AraC family transcriptional regulator [Butyricicoccus sp. AM27-36]|nr:AraC family transcriptional regulator [Butyricicoccus sp. AM27-36]
MLIIENSFRCFREVFVLFDDFIILFRRIWCFFVLAFCFVKTLEILHKKQGYQFGLYGFLWSAPKYDILYLYSHRGESMEEGVRFVSGQMPSLLYATKQIVAASTITRAIHRHERFTEMLYVYQGAGQYIAGGYSYPIRTGDILLYNQGDLHEVTSSLQHEIGTFCFGISSLQLCGLPEGHFTKAENGFVRPAMDEIDHMQSLSELIYEHAERRTSYSDEIVAQLLPALVLLSANLPPDARAADQPHNLVLANRIRQYIGTHFTEQLTLEDIGEAMSMSPYHLAHIFKEITGMSPIHYMIRCRVGEAQNLLISTDYSATQIAAIVGYTNVNHFNAIFAKLVGLPPIRYRRKYLENMQGSRLQ